MSKKIKFEKKMYFPDEYFISQDKKSILGEVTFKDILFLDYRDTDAGSNPREYVGLKKTNLEIIKSLLKDYKGMFRFLHSGVIVSATGIELEDAHTLNYDSCCLTNGNQTRFIILIIFLLKKFMEKNYNKDLNKKKFENFLEVEFKGQSDVLDFLNFLKFSKVTEVYKFLKNNSKYYKVFKEFDVNDFLNARIRITINSIDWIIESIGDLDEYAAGTLIANANNETQNVKIDDIFGSKHKRDLDKYLFKDFSNKYKGSVRIEYRLGEIVEKVEKVHILTLLRPVVATGILTKDIDVFKLSNQRAAVYTLFVKLFRRRDSKTKTIKAISRIIPLLYYVRMTYIIPQLKLKKNVYYREYIEKALNGELANTTIRDRIKIEKGELSVDSKKAIRNLVNFNVEHIFPVIVFRIRNLISIQQNKAILMIPEDKKEGFFKTITNTIYKKYIEMKLVGVLGSITDSVRRPDFFKSGEEAYETLKNMLNLQETDFIKKHRYLIR